MHPTADHPASPREYLNVRQVADALGVHTDLVYRVIREGSLPASRPFGTGRRQAYIIRRADLENFIDQGYSR